MIKSMKCLYNFVLFGIYIYLDILDESQGKVQFILPLRTLRIYYEAPPGVHVTTLKAYDSEASQTPVTFNMLEVRDYLFFHLDPTSGNLTTTRNIERTIGQMYHVMIAAVNQGEAEVIHIRISVTEFNRFPPGFEKDLYHKELHVNNPANTSVLRVHAHDADPVDYNSEIYYYLGKEAPDGILELDPNTGQLTLIGNLSQSQPCLTFAVIAEDGGSPIRQARTRVEITIKTISEPLDIHTLNATDSLVYVCWSRPEFGDVSGYIIKYRKVGGEESGTTIVNITTSASTKCITLKDLTPWTYYEFRLYGWNTNETGMRSNVNRFSTSRGYCSLDVCQNGECHMIIDDPGYKCECADGYYGDICDQFDQCSSKPCENFGVCRRTSNESYSCECPSGFSGQNCTIFNPCTIQPCENGGTCESSASYTYTCRCAQGFYGNTCQNSDACSSGPCRNGGTCHNTSNGFSCDCTVGYEGEQCEVHISECKSNPCFNGARCEDEIYTFTCLCTPGYHGNFCEEEVQCPPSTEITPQGVFYWNKTDHGTYSVLDCPYGVSDSRKEGFVRRYCHLLSNGLVKWEITHVKNCRGKDFYVAEQLTEKLRSFTEDPTRINSKKLQEATKQIENIVGYAIYDKKTAQSMFSVISNVLAVNDSVLDEADDSENTTSRLLEVVDRYTAQVKLEEGQSVVLNAHNIALKVLSWSHELYLKAEEFLTFSPKYQSYDVKQETLSKIVNNLTIQSYENQEELLVTVPVGAVERVDKEYTGEVRVKLVIYKNDKFFRSRLAVHKSPYRSVFQASINTLQITNLTEPLVYLMPTPEERRFICVYWNEKERTWVTNGLSTNQTGNLTICTSTHMTTFSILLDPIPTDQIHSDHQEALSIISYIGCVMSIFGLTLTILTYSLFRCLNRDRSGKILLNLCVSMLLMNIAFLIGSQQRSSVHVCVIVAIFIHYFLLTSLAWMCVEAINMYQMLIHVFASTETRFLLKRCLIAWGVPVLIVGATAGINFEVYGYENTFCMLSPVNPYAYYIFFLGPACIILVVNLIIFVMVTRILLQPRMNTRPGFQSHSSSYAVIGAQVRGAFTVMTLLGVTWIFGALAIDKVRLVFQYIFCIANSLQGFLIFLVRCLQFPEARNAWIQLLETGTLKKYRGVVPPGGSSYTTSNPNRKQSNGHTTTDRMLSNTSNDTTSSMIFNNSCCNPTPNKGSTSHDNNHRNLCPFSRHVKQPNDKDLLEEEINSENDNQSNSPFHGYTSDKTNANSLILSQNSDPFVSIGFIDDDEPSNNEGEVFSEDENGYQSSPKSKYLCKYGSSLKRLDEMVSLNFEESKNIQNHLSSKDFNNIQLCHYKTNDEEKLPVC